MRSNSSRGPAWATSRRRADAESAEAARETVATLRARAVDGVILGCTEIPLLLRELAHEVDLINPGQLLAEAAARAALQETET